LLDVVREVFLARRDLFHAENKRLDFSYGELLSASSVTELWSKVINKDIRGLQNQGFKEIVKFYRTRLGIDITQSGIAMDRLEESHDRRHILVHRLGVPDDEYRHQYKTENKTLTVTDDYLFGCIADLDHLSSWLYEEATKKMAESRSTRTRPEYVIKVTIETLSEDVPAVLNPDFNYHVGERIYRLADLLVARTVDSKFHTLTIGGQATAVRGYLKLLKAPERENRICMRERSVLRNESPSRLRWKLSDELLKKIWQALPPRPWPKHVHKQIAKDFHLSNSQTASAVGLFLQQGGQLQPNTAPNSELSGQPGKSG